MRSSRLILVFARLPHEESRVKPLVGGARGGDAEALYEAMFRRTLAVARATGVDTRLVTTGELPSALAFDGLEVAVQRGDTFPARLEHAVEDAFADGWNEVVLVGADTPALTAGHVRSAFAGLGSGGGRRAVLGPAHDGGYYLLGLDAFEPAVFREVPLSTPDAGRATHAALAEAGFTVSTLEPLRDLDDADDLRALASQPGALGALAARLLASVASFEAAAVVQQAVFASTLRARGPPAA